MKLSNIYLVLLTAGVCRAAPQVTAEVLHTATVDSDGGDRILDPLENRSGWVNPEDLAPMPQCIAQQDQSTWLSTMTKCTDKKCTRHFGAICTHHQWETQLTCLETEFSADVINVYFPYCSRSVLAKAQLYLWVHYTTGRTWLVHFGDANGLQNPSPASLAKGFEAISVTYKAPTCLTDSASALSMEPFQHVIASCSFTSTTQHTGNAARPWEYHESQQSMVALDSETVGYDLTHRIIRDGDYFDKECFCGAFTIDPNTEPCPGLREIDLTKERLWINVICGPTALPNNWKDMIKLVGFAYIPIEDWHWPACVTDMPKQVIELTTSQCASDACELDASGYCKEVKSTVDRACFCRNISYDSCGGSCYFFETRVDYLGWLHDLCGCDAFTIYPKTEPCPRLGQLDLMRERLWMNATCGPTVLPDNWTDMVNITGSTYIPIEDWHWPACVTDMPKQVIELTTGQCASDACELDVNGYCREVKSTVDRACFCRNISYDSCGGSCHFFETRVDYLGWLHDLCGCSAFTTYPKTEPCPRLRQIDLMKERPWMNATCGPTVLPDNWTDMVNITGSTYIPIEDWHWPACVTDMPKQVIELTTGQCASNACELDVNGYCREVKRTVDRACFCRNISYDSCGGSCHLFETRIEYVKWLHDLCGSMQNWHGLPDNWRQLAAPTTIDMIPWRWTIKPFNQSNTTSNTRLGSIEATQKCASNEWKLRSFALVNVAPFLAGFLSRRTGIHRIAHRFLWHPPPWCWFFTGILVAALQLLANWINAFLVQQTPGYEDVPVFQLMLFWGSMPRLSWLTILLIGVQPFEAMNFSAAASTLFAEIILQFLSSYYMIMTVNYGREHHFYLGRLEGAKGEGSATMMYAGALLWLIIITLAFVQLMLATRRKIRLTGSGRLDLPKWQRSKQPTSTIVEELIAQLNGLCIWLGEGLEQYWIDKSMASEETSLRSEEGNCRSYGTLPAQSPKHWASQKAFVQLYVLTIITMLLLWIAQWLFWGGFIALSSEEFCPPNLGVLTAVWIAFSLAAANVGATL